MTRSKSGLAASWSRAASAPRFKLVALLTPVWLFMCLTIVNKYLQYNETREGVELIDPILDTLTPTDLSVPLFALVYGSLITALIWLAGRPRLMLIGLQAYGWMVLFRTMMMYTIPLEPPPGMILLVDPFVSAFGGGPNWTRDLFFSGHTSTTFLCTLSVASSRLRLALGLACASVAVLVLVQHAHYTVDVLVAPFVAFASHRIARGGFDRFVPTAS